MITMADVRWSMAGGQITRADADAIGGKRE